MAGMMLAIVGVADTAGSLHAEEGEEAERPLLLPGERDEALGAAQGLARQMRRMLKGHIAFKRDEDAHRVWTPVMAPLWGVFGEVDTDSMESVPLGLVLIWVSVFITNVVLVNLLVAMLADTFAKAIITFLLIIQLVSVFN